MADVSMLDIIIAAKAEGMGAFKEAQGGVMGLGQAGAAVGIALGVGLVGGLVESVKKAGDFQEKMTSLQTGAGELKSNMDLVSKGILDMSGQVGQSSSALADGMYMIESAGFHGAQGLSVLRAAAEGAKVGNADMAVVANAVTSALNAYGLSGDHATQVTNDLVATVASGKMHMEDLAGALGTVLPEAAGLHVSLADVTGAMATMTMQGTDAATAATGLRFTMSSLANPTAAAQKEMTQFGLSGKAVGEELGSKGLQATMETISEAVGKKFPQGSSEYVAAMAKMLGGTRGLNTALELTGTHMDTWKANIESIQGAVKEGGNSVKGWSEVQGDFNFKVTAAKDALDAASISVGTKLLPAVASLLAQITPLLPKFAELAGQLGSALIPVISGVVTVLGFLAQHGNIVIPVLIGIAAAIGMLKVAQFVNGIVLMVNALRVAAVSGGIYSAVMDAMGISELIALWPILLIIAAIAILAVGIYLLVTHWDQVRAALERFAHAALNVGGVVLGAVLGMVNSVIGAVVAFAGRIVSMAESLWSQFSSKPVYWITYVAVYIPIKLAELQGAIAAWLAKIIANAAVWSAQMIVHGVTAATQFVANVIQFVSELPGKFNTWLISVVEQIPGWAGRLVSEGINAASQFSQAIVTEVQKLPGQMLSIGGDIIRGLISGVQGMVGNLKGAISQAVSGALDAAKAAAGIHSPSTVFANEVGMPISQGIAMGISRGQSVVQAAIAGVASPTGGIGPSIGLAASASFSGAQGGQAGGQVGGTSNDRLDTIISLLEQQLGIAQNGQGGPNLTPGRFYDAMNQAAFWRGRGFATTTGGV